MRDSNQISPIVTVASIERARVRDGVSTKISWRRVRLARRLALLSALLPVLFSAPARAEPDNTDTQWTTGLGIFIGYSVGAHQGVEWGVEAFSTVLIMPSHCYAKERGGFGPLARAAWVGLRDPKITLALYGGLELQRAGPAITGELGGTYVLGPYPGLGVHVGLMPEWSHFNVAARITALLGDFSVVGGGRYLQTYGEPFACAPERGFGRPLRSAHGLVEAPAPRRRATGRSGNGESGAAGRAWERDAQYECASVPAFLQLARELLAHDAPLALVERALDAAVDEIRHTHLCAGVATELLGVAVSPSMPDVAPRPTPSLAQLAAESWLDGCLGEGSAAARAGRALDLARHGGARRALARIEPDERRHAELAWDVLQWTFERGGAGARDAVRSLPLPAPATAIDDDGPLEPYGQLRSTDADALFERHASACVRRRDARLDGSARRSR